MLETLSYVIPVVCVFLSYICGRLQSVNSRKIEAKREQYEKFYVPYIKYLYRGHFFNGISYSSLSFESRSLILDLIFSNLQFIDVKTTKHIPIFYDSCLNMFEYEDGSSGYDTAPKDLDSVFNQMTLCVLFEAKALSKTLHLPDIATIFLSDYQPHTHK